MYVHYNVGLGTIRFPLIKSLLFYFIACLLIISKYQSIFNFILKINIRVSGGDKSVLLFDTFRKHCLHYLENIAMKEIN